MAQKISLLAYTRSLPCVNGLNYSKLVHFGQSSVCTGYLACTRGMRWIGQGCTESTEEEVGMKVSLMLQMSVHEQHACMHGWIGRQIGSR